MEVKKQEQITGETQPAKNYVDVILSNKGLVTITQIAKDYGMSAQDMNDLLCRKDILYKESGHWFLCEEYQCMGYTKSMDTEWTQRGRLFIYESLKRPTIYNVKTSQGHIVRTFITEEAILPVIEREDKAS